MNVETIEFINDLEKRVAFASVKIGDVIINGIVVWRSGNGRLRVFFPSYRHTYEYKDAIELSPDLRSEIEAEVIAAYKTAKKDAQNKAEQQSTASE